MGHNRRVNDAQRKALDWLAAGSSTNPPDAGMKTSVQALAARGLAVVRRRRGVWTAEPTDAGRYFAEHGDYPQAAPALQTNRRRTTPRTEDTRAPATRQRARKQPQPDPPEADTTPTPLNQRDEEVPLKQVVRNPHPAVREIRDRPGRLPKFARRRCVLIAHSLVTEAITRGWAVTPVAGEARRDHWGTRSTHYDSGSLLLIDAGHSPIGLIFDEVTKRQPHQDTPKEAADRGKGRYVWTSGDDYVGTGRLRLHLVQDNRKLPTKYVDTATTRIEDKTSTILDAIEAASDQAFKWAEQRPLREEEEQARRAERERVAALRSRYEEWEVALIDGAQAWRQHLQLREYLASLGQHPPQEAEAFIEWARGYLEATDPGIRFPEGELPEWTHEERRQAGRYVEHQHRW